MPLTLGAASNGSSGMPMRSETPASTGTFEHFRLEIAANACVSSFTSLKIAAAAHYRNANHIPRDTFKRCQKFLFLKRQSVGEAWLR
jgi:hypothetical protein